jgi:phage tail protein X
MFAPPLKAPKAKVFPSVGLARATPTRAYSDIELKTRQAGEIATGGWTRSGPSWSLSGLAIHPPDRQTLDAARHQFLQRKPAIGRNSDLLEHEADRAADRMMRMEARGAAGSAAALRARRAGGAPVLTGAPPLVHEVLRQPGRPLDDNTRAFFELRFGHDFGAVRVHTDDRAARSAEAVNARAYTVGSHVVFRRGEYAPGNSAGLKLMSHELAHVVQQTDAPAPRASTIDGVTISGRTQPTIQRAIHFKDAVPKLGTFAIDGQPIGNGLGAHEDVTITFSPDPDSPVADPIDFVQIAKPPGNEKPGDWARLHPDEKLKSDAATTTGSATHQTQQGDTLTSVSLQHFGTAEKAATILDANRGRLMWWSAQSNPQQSDQLTRPLPVGVLLNIPEAIRGGFMVDIEPRGVSPRLHDAQMNDRPGGGPIAGRFEFESAAFAKDIGLYYGAVWWGFNYDTNGITNETARLVPKVSDTLDAAVTSFNRVYKNKHIVQQGDTLNSISIKYFGSTADAHRIYLLNRTNPALTTDDPTAPVTAGTQLEVGVGPSVWDQLRSEPEKK